MSANDANRLSVKYLMYRVSARSCRVVTKCALFILSSVIFRVIHITFKTNQKLSASSLLRPLKNGNFIVFDMLNSGGGGGSVGKGVCCGGEGEGGVDE